MSKDSEKELKIGIAIAVISGIILMFVESIRSFVVKTLSCMLSFIVKIYFAVVNYLHTYHQVNGIIIVILSFLSILATVLILIILIQIIRSKSYFIYTEDMFHNVIWRWRWKNSNVDNLWCFCPTCDAILVYDDSSTERHRMDPKPRTELICEHCNTTVSVIHGYNKDQLLGLVEREIDRKVRNNLYEKNDK